MGTQYSHLTLEERCRLRGLMEIGLGVGEIARRLGRHRGTIHREVKTTGGVRLDGDKIGRMGFWTPPTDENRAIRR